MRDLRKILGDELGEDPATIRADLHNIEHHRAHMASSYYLSPFDQAACLTIDGFGSMMDELRLVASAVGRTMAGESAG